MDQKNTIVKCNRSPKCLFEHNGVCDNYVVNIGADGQCECYVETAPKQEEINAEAQELYQCATEMLERQGVTIIPSSSEPKRGQRAKCNVFDDMMDINDKHLGEAVTVVAMMEEKNEV